MSRRRHSPLLSALALLASCGLEGSPESADAPASRVQFAPRYQAGQVAASRYVLQLPEVGDVALPDTLHFVAPGAVAGAQPQGWLGTGWLWDLGSVVQRDDGLHLSVRGRSAVLRADQDQDEASECTTHQVGWTCLASEHIGYQSPHPDLASASFEMREWQATSGGACEEHIKQEGRLVAIDHKGVEYAFGAAQVSADDDANAQLDPAADEADENGAPSTVTLDDGVAHPHSYHLRSMRDDAGNTISLHYQSAQPEAKAQDTHAADHEAKPEKDELGECAGLAEVKETYPVAVDYQDDSGRVLARLELFVAPKDHDNGHSHAVSDTGYRLDAVRVLARKSTHTPWTIAGEYLFTYDKVELNEACECGHALTSLRLSSIARYGPGGSLGQAGAIASAGMIPGALTTASSRSTATPIATTHFSYATDAAGRLAVRAITKVPDLAHTEQAAMANPAGGNVPHTLYAQQTTKKSYFYFGGRRISMMDEAGTVRFLLSDHLGSSTLTTAVSGYVQGEIRYRPFGAEHWSSGSTSTDYGFTGERHHADVGGLVHMGARFYDPDARQWTSADTIVPAPGSSQSYNRYSYVRNRPLNAVDPSGHRDLEYDDEPEPCHPGAPCDTGFASASSGPPPCHPGSPCDTGFSSASGGSAPSAFPGISASGNIGGTVGYQGSQPSLTYSTGDAAEYATPSVVVVGGAFNTGCGLLFCWDPDAGEPMLSIWIKGDDGSYHNFMDPMPSRPEGTEIIFDPPIGPNPFGAPRRPRRVDQLFGYQASQGSLKPGIYQRGAGSTWWLVEEYESLGRRFKTVLRLDRAPTRAHQGVEGTHVHGYNFEQMPDGTWRPTGEAFLGESSLLEFLDLAN